MTEIETLKLISLVNKGEISKKMFGQVVAYYNENREKSEQIADWQKIAELRKKVLLAMGFEIYSQNFFTKIIYNIGEKKGHNGHNMRQKIMFEFFGIMDIISATIDEYGGHNLWNNWTKEFGIVDIIQNPDEFPDLVRYFEIRNDTKAMKKFIKQAKKE